MTDDANPFSAAIWLILGLDADLVEIVALSLAVTISAVVLASLIAMPLGAALALFRFPGRTPIVIIVNAAMGLPPVVVGLAVYLLLSRSGPLGTLGLLYTPGAMIIAQIVLVLPIVASITRQIVDDLWREYREQLLSFGVSRLQAIGTLLVEARFSLAIAVLAGFGRATAEVGAVMIVGGNIDHYTRVMTTAIALETSKGNLAFALGLGVILLTISLTINALVYGLEVRARALQAAS